jgi:hypothetical protein
MAKGSKVDVNVAFPEISEIIFVIPVYINVYIAMPVNKIKRKKYFMCVPRLCLGTHIANMKLWS